MSDLEGRRVARARPVRVVATRQVDKRPPRVDVEPLGPSRLRIGLAGRHPVDLDLWLEREADHQIAHGPGWRCEATHDRVEQGRRRRRPLEEGAA